MTKITITIKTENAAFVGDPEMEISRILMVLSRKMEEGRFFPDDGLRDTNGNRVGTVEVEE